MNGKYLRSLCDQACLFWLRHCLAAPLSSGCQGVGNAAAGGSGSGLCVCGGLPPPAPREGSSWWEGTWEGLAGVSWRNAPSLLRFQRCFPASLCVVWPRGGSHPQPLPGNIEGLLYMSDSHMAGSQGCRLGGFGLKERDGARGPAGRPCGKWLQPSRGGRPTRVPRPSLGFFRTPPPPSVSCKPSGASPESKRAFYRCWHFSLGEEPFNCSGRVRLS